MAHDERVGLTAVDAQVNDGHVADEHVDEERRRVGEPAARRLLSGRGESGDALAIEHREHREEDVEDLQEARVRGR